MCAQEANVENRTGGLNGEREVSRTAKGCGSTCSLSAASGGGSATVTICTATRAGGESRLGMMSRWLAPWAGAHHDVQLVAANLLVQAGDGDLPAQQVAHLPCDAPPRV